MLDRHRAVTALTFLASALVAGPVLADDIHIGWLPALTGPLASSAIAENYGANVAIDEINAAGGVDGRQLVLVTRDTGSDPAKAVSFAKELMYNENVDILLGPANSGEALPVAPAAAQAGKPVIVLGALAELIDPENYPYAFRAIVTNDQWVSAAVDFTLNDLASKKVAILSDTSGYGTISRDAIVAELAAGGVDPVYVSLIDPNRPDVTGELNKAQEAGADVVLAWSASSGLLARILNARGDIGWDVPVVGQPTLGFGGVGELLSDPANWENVFHTGFHSTTRAADGTVPALTADFLEENKDTIDAVLPNGLPVILLGYSAVYLIADAIEVGGSTDPEAIKAAFEGFQNVELPYASFSYGPGQHDGFPDSGIVMNVSNSLDGGLYDQAGN